MAFKNTGLEANLWSVERAFVQLRPGSLRPDLIRSVQSLTDPLLIEPARRLTAARSGRLQEFQG
jgi:hypothetical protein